MTISIFQNNPKTEWTVCINSGDVMVSFESEEEAKDFALKLIKDQLSL